MPNRNIAPQIKDFEEISLAKPEIKILQNGVEMQIINNGDEAVNRLDLIFKGGGYEQQKLLTGALMASMLKNGSADYSAKEIAEKLDYYGAWLQTQVFEHHSVITIYSINRCFEAVLDIVNSIVKAPTFPDSELSVLKSRLISSLKNDNEKVRYLALIGFNKIYYGENHPLGKVVNENTVKFVLKKDLESFHKKFYNSNNLSIIISGKITSDITDKIEQYFGTEWGDNEKNSDLVSIPLSETENKLIITNKINAIQSGIVLGLTAIPRIHPDYIPLRILTTLFGGYFGSRLMASIREEKGYTYGISASLNGKSDSSYIQISTECSVDYTWDLIAAVKEEMRRLRDELVPDEELNVVKSYLKSSFAKILDSPFSIADFYLNQIVIGFDASYFKSHINIIDEITPEALQKIAQKYYLEENLYISIAGAENILKKKKSISC